MGAEPLPRARARQALEQFLSGATPDGIRSEILASWTRCRVEGVEPSQLALTYCAEVDPSNSKLFRAAKPVLDRFAARLHNTHSSIILADRNARVLGRWSGDRTLDNQLERISVACGYTLTEAVAGTNGIGTALEEGRPAIVWGGEHYVETFMHFTCIGAPIRNPLTRQTEGAVNIACRNRDTNSLILPMVLEIAGAIEDELYRDTAARERTLFDHFLRRSRNSLAPIVTMSEQFFVANTPAARLLDGANQALLWEQASQVMSRGTAQGFDLSLGERSLEAKCSPVELAGRNIGVVIELSERTAPTSRLWPERSVNPAEPGLIGSSQAWQDIIALVRGCGPSRLPLVFLGEPGTGKLTLAQYAHRLSAVSGPLTLHDASLVAIEGSEPWLQSLRQKLLHPEGTLLIRHIDLLDTATATAVCGLLDSPFEVAPRLMATASDRPPEKLEAGGLIDRFVVRATVAPLRERPEDLKEVLVGSLQEYSGGSCIPRFAPEALQALLRLDWPGNVRQVRGVVESLAASCRSTVIQLSHLPEDLRGQAGRRRLSRLERAELEQILLALSQSGGNKVEAAKALGIGRATLYRKLRTFGVELDRSMF